MGSSSVGPQPDRYASHRSMPKRDAGSGRAVTFLRRHRSAPMRHVRLISFSRSRLADPGRLRSQAATAPTPDLALPSARSSGEPR